MSAKQHTEVKRNEFLFDEIKNKKNNRTNPDLQLKEFSLTKHKLGLERTMKDWENYLEKNPTKKRENCKNQI